MQLALALINTEEWYGRGPDGVDDDLDVPGRLDEFLDRWDLAVASPGEARLRSLRTLLRRMFTALAEGGEPTKADIERLDGYLRRGALHRRLEAGDGYQVVLTAEKEDSNWGLSEIAASFAELLADGERTRIKHCENPECRWAFYDESKNRRRRWCTSAECGNVFKVRAFRARRRAQNATEGDDRLKP